MTTLRTGYESLESCQQRLVQEYLVNPVFTKKRVKNIASELRLRNWWVLKWYQDTRKREYMRHMQLRAGKFTD